MKTLIRKTSANLRIHLMMKLALASAICGLALLSTNAFGQVSLQLNVDCAGVGTATPAPAGFTKVMMSPNNSVNNYTFANVCGSDYTLTVTNSGSWNNGNASSTCEQDGWYTGNIPGATNRAGFILSGLPSGETVTIYACFGWNGSGQAAKIVYGGQTNQVVVGSVASPSMTTLQNVGRAVVDVDGIISGLWTGPTTGQGQIGALIFDIEPCQPAITMNGSNPLLVPQNST